MSILESKFLRHPVNKELDQTVACSEPLVISTVGNILLLKFFCFLVILWNPQNASPFKENTIKNQIVSFLGFCDILDTLYSWGPLILLLTSSWEISWIHDCACVRHSAGSTTIEMTQSLTVSCSSFCWFAHFKRDVDLLLDYSRIFK